MRAVYSSICKNIRLIIPINFVEKYASKNTVQMNFLLKMKHRLNYAVLHTER